MNYQIKAQQLRQLHEDMQKMLATVRIQMTSGMLSDREAMLMRSIANNLTTALSRMEYMMPTSAKA